LLSAKSGKWKNLSTKVSLFRFDLRFLIDGPK
jgi:hypothetical protein